MAKIQHGVKPNIKLISPQGTRARLKPLGSDVGVLLPLRLVALDMSLLPKRLVLSAASAFHEGRHVSRATRSVGLNRRSSTSAFPGRPTSSPYSA